MRTRPVILDGHRTSLSLEDAFWVELATLSRQRGLSLSTLVAEVDRRRSPGSGTLSGALRIYVFTELSRPRASRSRMT